MEATPVELSPTTSFIAEVVNSRRLVFLLPLLAFALAFGGSYLISNTYTARATLLPPPQTNSGTSTLASLGALASFAGSSLRAPQEQYASLMQSDAVLDKVIVRFDLQKIYDTDTLTETRNELRKKMSVSLSKKDSIISVEVDDHDRKRAADITNNLIVELQRLVDQLTLSEAKGRRIFFEAHLDDTRRRLAEAQKQLQNSTINEGAVKVEPRISAENFGRAQSEVMISQTKLEILRQRMVESAPEVQAEKTRLQRLEGRLAALNSTASPGDRPSDYVERLRDFKYVENLFEFYAKQYESAKLDESKEGPTLQVVDHAVPPEKKSRPKRLYIGLTALGSTFFLALLFLLGRKSWRDFRQGPEGRAFVAQLK